MILIDDAGWGSLVGGVIIGACREESPWTQHAFREIPVAFFQGPTFEQQLYLDEVTKAVLDLLKELQTPKDEEVHICTGYVLRKAREAVTAAGYRVTATKIREPLQSLVEHEHLARVQALGVETNLEIITTKQALFFWQCVKWVKDGDVERQGHNEEKAKHCKTGWATWPIWASLPYSRARDESKRFKAQRRRLRRAYNNR